MLAEKFSQEQDASQKNVPPKPECKYCGYIFSVFDEICPRCEYLARQKAEQQEAAAAAAQAVAEPVAPDNMCQYCGYILGPFDSQCPRCAKLSAQLSEGPLAPTRTHSAAATIAPPPVYAAPLAASRPIYHEDEGEPEPNKFTEYALMAVSGILLILACVYIHTLVAQNVAEAKTPDKYKLNTPARHIVVSRPKLMPHAAIPELGDTGDDASGGIVAPNDLMTVAELTSGPQNFR